MQCDYFVSEHEEDIVQLMQEKDFSQEELITELCEDITGLIKSHDSHIILTGFIRSLCVLANLNTQ